MLALEWTTLLQSIAVTIGLMAAAVTGIVVLAKSPIIGRPIAYVLRKTAVEPIGAWFKHLVGEAVDDRITYRLNQPNGGSSLYDIGMSVRSIQNHLGLGDEETLLEPGHEVNALVKTLPDSTMEEAS